MRTFKAPSPSLVVAALARLVSLQHERVFYEGLDNPLWVRPLLTAGAFAVPPEPIVDGEGLIREQYWPQISYLTRMADSVPVDVVDVLRSLRNSRNSWVRRGAFEIARALPVSEIMRLREVITGWNPEFGWRTDPRDLADLCRRLLDNGETKFGISFANMLYRPRADATSPGSPVTSIEEYWLAQELPATAVSLGDAALTVIVPWLEEWERVSGRYTEAADYSALSRPRIDQPPGYYPDTEQALIDVLRNAAREAFRNTPTAALSAFGRSRMLLVRKIALSGVTEAIESSPSPADDLIQAAYELLAMPESGAGQCRPEFVDLYRILFEHGVKVASILERVVAAGPLGSRQLLIERLAARGLDEVETIATLEEERSEHRLLSLIGPDHLPELGLRRLRELDITHGVVPPPQDDEISSPARRGIAAPSTLEDLEGLASADLVERLRFLQSDAADTVAQLRLIELTDNVIAKHPDALAGASNLAALFGPAIVSAILYGWNKAQKVGLPLPWSQVLETLEDVMRRDDPSNDADDEDSRGTYLAAAQLLVDVLNENTVAESTRQALAEIVLVTLRSGGGWKELLSRPDRGSDPATISLNARWPVLLRGLVRLVGDGSGAPWHSAALAVLDSQLALPDPSGAAAAVVGEGFACLYTGAPDWLHQRRDELFGTKFGLSRTQQLALTTVLSWFQVFPPYLEFLREPISAALALSEPAETSWRGSAEATELIGDWVVTCLIWGKLAADDPLVEAFFTLASPEARGAVIGRIAWSYLKAQEVDRNTQERFELLWDHRVEHVRSHREDRAELKDFYWFVRSEKFEVAWWLPRLIEAVELDPDLKTHGMIGTQLAAASREWPDKALEVLKLLVGRLSSSDMNSYDLAETAAPTVIGSALDAGDEKLAIDAMSLMNHLGAIGYIDLEQKVIERRAS